MLRPYSTVARVFASMSSSAACGRVPRAAHRPRLATFAETTTPVAIRNVSRSNCGDASSTLCPNDSHNAAARAHRVDAVRMGRNVGQRRRVERDPQAPRRIGALREKRAVERRRVIRIAGGRTMGRIEERRAVADGARHHVTDRHAAPAFADVGTRAAFARESASSRRDRNTMPECGSNRRRRSRARPESRRRRPRRRRRRSTRRWSSADSTDCGTRRTAPTRW